MIGISILYTILVVQLDVEICGCDLCEWCSVIFVGTEKRYGFVEISNKTLSKFRK